jgi:hypothetical protein
VHVDAERRPVGIDIQHASRHARGTEAVGSQGGGTNHIPATLRPYRPATLVLERGAED